MPKEIVQFARTQASDGQDIMDPTSIELVWSKAEAGGNLQLRFQRHSFGPDRHIEPIDQHSDQLSRDDCNRLIRALRRARDQVYGTDA